MKQANSKLIKRGNSYYVLIPTPIFWDSTNKFKVNDEVIVSLEDEQLIITKDQTNTKNTEKKTDKLATIRAWGEHLRDVKL